MPADASCVLPLGRRGPSAYFDRAGEGPMANMLDGKSGAIGGKYAIVVSRYNEHITANLLAGAVETLKAGGVRDEAIDVAWVPGAWELPLVVQRLALSEQYVAVLCLGAVIK